MEAARSTEYFSFETNYIRRYIAERPPPLVFGSRFLGSQDFGQICDLGVQKYGFIRGKARRRREKIAILGTLNGDFQREIDQKMVKNLVQISGSQ